MQALKPKPNFLIKKSDSLKLSFLRCSFIYTQFGFSETQF
ncbi:hypothetical protein CFP56_027640 [Quercus suber]|uniref:Ribosomal protein L32 n=1 Tax=Quercus suber TaxID=58331 RepID=A0AAW0JWK7_QUESU